MYFCHALQNEASQEVSTETFKALCATEETCNYSIVLFTSGFNGWGGNYLNVYVNNNISLSQITLVNGQRSLPFMFNVYKDANITVEFVKTTLFAIAHSYSVYTNADATGMQAYASLPFYSDISNPCTNLICTYSASIVIDPATPCNFSLYINGVATIYKETLSKIVNFNVTQGDSITGLMEFARQNDSVVFNYSLYNGTGMTGQIFFDWLASMVVMNGPKSPAAIPNFCEVQPLTLSTFLGPYFGGSEIQVSVVPSTLTQNPFPVDLALICGNNIINQNRLSSSNSTDNYPFPLPSGDLQGCYFLASSDDPNYQYADSEKAYIIVVQSPFGGNLYYISPEEQVIFTRRIAGPPSDPWAKLTSTDLI